ncbi:MAG: bifunctional hydroxymethylpyrimidine kinase/phosphomethylpyrimidine kinase [Verrucomicrobiota bacterium]|nr:bifunctional hydroxymethylpyrimidine kinase/phosphomethylpyrimidine kinase [Verrucomicrobiota bacterium]
MKQVALTVAGSDNSAGAGIQADLKTFSACGVFGTTAITCIVSENPDRVVGIQAVKASLVASQIATAREYFKIQAVKTGMLYERGIIDAIIPEIAKLNSPLIVDPVMVATSGAVLLKKDALNAICTKIIPMASLVTPNLNEAELLLSRKIQSLEDAKGAVVSLVERFGVPFLLKGGHLKSRDATDILYDGKVLSEFSAPFIRGIHTHGTGCTYSAAICAGMARGMNLEEAVGFGKKYITGALKNILRWPRKRFALNHFWSP